MPSMIDRVWNTSPASLTHAIRRRLKRLRAGESWHEMTAGPARGVKLILPEPLPDWAQEMIAGTYDQFLYDAIARKRKLSGATCWDIGANIGYHTHAFATQGAQVVSFEPNAANIARLREHLDKNSEAAKRVRVVAAAVADRDGELEFVQSADVSAQSSGSHLASASPPEQAAVYARFERRTVPAVTMDTLVEKQGEKPPHIIKIDVEGAEHLVLEGGRRMLAKHKPLLLVEVHHICVMLSLTRLLTELGYKLEVLDQQHASPSRCFVIGSAA